MAPSRRTSLCRTREALLLAAACSLPRLAEGSGAMGCTTMGITPGATVDGSTIVTHTADCSTCDSRVARVSARSWPVDAQRPVYPQRAEYPRFVVADRSPTYEPAEGQQLDVPRAHLPQVEHTNGYWENTYAYLNDHGLALGESTCAANFPNTADNAVLPIRELTQLAQERCRTVRCAISTMGALAEQYGFYGEDPGRPGAGEALMLGDGKEVWVFHITGDPTGRSAFWAAQRVPDGHIAVVANNFIIREVDCDDSSQFMCSTDLPSKAKAAGAWDGRGKLDWLESMAPDIRTFSYTPGFDPIPFYTTARIWRVYSRTAPSRGFKLSRDPRDYPFSVKVERPLNASDVMALQRDHYEGTEIDLTVGGFAGPYGSPNRNQLGVGMKVVGGQFARAISIPRTSSTILGQSYPQARNATGDLVPSGVSKLWVAPDAPASSVFAPFYAGAHDFFEAYRIGTMTKYNDKSAWWVFDFVANWMDLNYKLMSADVGAKIAELQGHIDDRRAPVEAAALRHLQAGEESAAHQLLTSFQTHLQQHVVDTWREFGHFLIMKYNDGYVNFPNLSTSIGYPAWWLQMFNLNDDIRPHWAQPSDQPPPLYVKMGPGPFEALPADWKPTDARPTEVIPEAGVSWARLLLACALCLATGLGGGFVLGRQAKRSVGVNGDASTPFLKNGSP